MNTLEKALIALIAIAFITGVTLIATGDGTRKPQDIIHLSTVTWGGVQASVPEPVMREMNLKPGQEIDDETAKELTERIVKYFKLEANR